MKWYAFLFVNWTHSYVDWTESVVIVSFAYIYSFICIHTTNAHCDARLRNDCSNGRHSALNYIYNFFRNGNLHATHSTYTRSLARRGHNFASPIKMTFYELASLKIIEPELVLECAQTVDDRLHSHFHVGQKQTFPSLRECGFNSQTETLTFFSLRAFTTVR